MNSIFRIVLTAGCFLSLGCQGPQNGFVPSAPRPLRVNLMEDVRNFADYLRADDQDMPVMLDDPSLTAVTKEFGPAVISLKSLPMRSGTIEATIKPWSSWWYPKKEDYIFTDKDGRASSPLTKYDEYRKRRAEESRKPQPGSAAEIERKAFNGTALTWEGLCDAWALASTLRPEPTHPVTINARGKSFNFKVSDLKVLLLKTFEAVEDAQLKYYGQKFTGDFKGWIYPDIFPDQFHRFLQVQLEGKRLPFVMDHDAGIEVWNVPVYKTNYVIDAIPGDANSVFVRTWLYSAESTQPNEKEFVGTKEMVREYNYVLKGSRNAAGDLVVSSGYWVKGPSGVNSRRDHPDYLITVPNPDKLVRKSWNSEIDIEVVDEILSKAH